MENSNSRFLLSSVYDYDYTIEYGEEAQPGNIQRVFIFHGQCFNCGAYRHNQLNCPLQYCCNCQAYGHSSKSCSWFHRQKKKKRNSYR